MPYYAFSELAAYLATGFALVILGGAIGLALRRRAPGQALRSATDRTARILAPSFLFSGGMTAFFAILFAGEGQFAKLLLGWLQLTAGALAFVALFDFIAMKLGATRIRRWLIVAIVLFVTPLLIILFVTSGISETVRSFDGRALALLGPAAALVWWSFLGARRD